MSKDIIIGALLIFFAIFLDVTQALIGLGVTGAFGIIGAAVGWFPVLGQIVATGSTLGGDIIGSTIDFCLSVSFGTMLIMLLIYFRMFYPMTIFAGGMVECLPFLDILPGWTVMTARCVWKKAAENSPVLSLAQTAATGNVLSTATAAAKTMNQERQKRSGRDEENISKRKLALKSQIDGIRPANDNNSIAYAA